MLPDDSPTSATLGESDDLLKVDDHRHAETHDDNLAFRVHLFLFLPSYPSNNSVISPS